MNINKSATLLMIIFTLLGNVILAQQSFNLVQAQEYALKNNVNNKNARLDIDIAQQKIWETTAFGLPQVNGSIAYQNIFEVPVMNFNGNDIPLGVQENWTYTLTASQLIFNGSYIVGLKTSKTYSKLSDAALAKTEIEIKENIANSYYMILTLEEGKKSLDSSLSNMQKTFYEMSEMCKLGFIEDTDTDQMQLNVSNLKNSILSVGNQILLSYKLLKYQMGMKVSDSIILTDNLDDLISQMKAEELILTPFDLNSNVNYQLLETQEKLSYLNMQFERSKTLPSIAAFYQHQQLGEKPAFNFTPPNVLGLSVEIPIISGGGRYARINQSKLELEKMTNTN
jgi:outer membrane protein TolC